MKGSDFLQKLLATYGVDRVYGVLGREAASLLFDKDHSQKFYLFRNELSAGTSAVAATRLTGRPQVCFSTLGPGVTHMMTAMATAAQDRHPVLFIAAQLETHSIDYNNAHQCLDAVSVTRPLTKGSYEPTTLDALAVAVDRAFTDMLAYPFGPAFISLPINLMDEVVDEDLAAKWLVDHTALPLAYTVGSTNMQDKLIAEAAKLLDGAKNPIIVLGDTVAKVPEAAATLRPLLEKLNIPAIATYSAKGILPFGHPLNLGTLNGYLDALFEGHVLQSIFETADTLLLLGYDMIEHHPNGWKFGSAKKIISLNYFDNRTNKAFVPEVKLTGNLAGQLSQLVVAVKPREAIAKDAATARDTIVNRMTADMQAKDSGEGVTVPQAIQALNDAYGDYNYIVANDIGMHRHVVGTYFMPQEPHHYLTSAGLSSFGTGIGMAIGAALSQSDKRVVLIAGDGGFHSNSGDLETIVRNNLPVTVLLLNNNANALIRRYQLTGDEHTQDVAATEFMNVDFVKLAEANGVKASRATTPAELQKALAGATKQAAPMLIEIAVHYPDLYLNPYAKHWDGSKPVFKTLAG